MGSLAKKGVNPIKEIRNRVEGVDQVILSVVSPEGQIISRPAPFESKVGFAETCFWIYLDRDCPHVNAIHEGRWLSLFFMSSLDERYTLIRGLASLVEDESERRDHWHDVYFPWYSDGVSEPSLALIRIEPLEVETWDPSLREMISIDCRGLREPVILSDQSL